MIYIILRIYFWLLNFKFYSAQIEILRVRFPVASIRLERVYTWRTWECWPVATGCTAGGPLPYVLTSFSNPIWSRYLERILGRRRIIRGCASSRVVRNVVSLSPLDDKSVRLCRFAYVWQIICVSVRRMTKRFKEKKMTSGSIATHLARELERCTSWI